MKNFKGIVTDIMAKQDMAPLADGLVILTDFNVTGVNLNSVVVGATGCGKTTSITEPRLLHTFNSSIVVPVAKSAVAGKYIPLFKKRGYKTYMVDFCDASRGNVGYDPMDYVKTTEDAIELARQLGGFDRESKPNDRYWDQSSESAIAAIILLVKLNAEYDHKKPEFKNVIKILKYMDYEQVDENDYKLNIAGFFGEAEKKFPGNPASQLIKAVEVLPCRTAPCMIGTIRAAVENFYSDIIMDVVSKDEKMHLDELGDERSVFFIVTNPFNETCSRMINIMYGQMFKSLFEKAEKNADGSLDIPIHVICDDFACSTKINGFERYISIFRQAGISVSILLQSESQLKALYGEHAGTTILNNMDTYIYMGSQDVSTVTSISKRMNLPFDKVMYMEQESVMISRRGCMPFIGKRYRTYEDPVYKMMMASRKEERP